MRTDDSILMTGVLGAALGAAFGFFEQGLQDPRERHVLKYAVLGGLGFAAFAALKAGHGRPRALVGADAEDMFVGQDPERGADLVVVAPTGAAGIGIQQLSPQDITFGTWAQVGSSSVIPRGTSVKGFPIYFDPDSYSFSFLHGVESGWAVWWQGAWAVVKSSDVKRAR